jgi:hypothetical protein
VATRAFALVPYLPVVLVGLAVLCRNGAVLPTRVKLGADVILIIAFAYALAWFAFHLPALGPALPSPGPLEVVWAVATILVLAAALWVAPHKTLFEF